MLDEIFSRFDDLTHEYKLEKIKTIGDAYMVAAGAPVSRPDHAHACIYLALEMRSVIKEYSESSVPYMTQACLNDVLTCCTAKQGRKKIPVYCYYAY